MCVCVSERELPIHWFTAEYLEHPGFKQTKAPGVRNFTQVQLAGAQAPEPHLLLPRLCWQEPGWEAEQSAIELAPRCGIWHPLSGSAHQATVLVLLSRLLRTKDASWWIKTFFLFSRNYKIPLNYIYLGHLGLVILQFKYPAKAKSVDVACPSPQPCLPFSPVFTVLIYLPNGWNLAVKHCNWKWGKRLSFLDSPKDR